MQNCDLTKDELIKEIMRTMGYARIESTSVKSVECGLESGCKTGR